ncbi:MAG: tetratricopeptide repeat protein [Gemmatimonadota bacterium]
MKRIILAFALLFVGVDVAHGQTAQALINGVKARISKNKWADAREVLAEQMPQYADNAELHYLYALALVKVSPDSASKALAELALADQLNGEPDAADGDAVQLQTDIDQAVLALWGPLVNDGVRFLAQNKLPEAEAKLTRAVEINPRGKQGHLALGAVRSAQKRYDEAIVLYNQALAIDPAYKDAMLRLGIAYQLKAEAAAASTDAAVSGQAETIAGQAISVYEDYLTKNPGDVDVQIQLAGMHATLGHMDKAEPIIRTVLAADSVDAVVYTDFGFRLANASQYDLAEETLVRAILLSDSLDSEPLSYLSFVRIRKNDLPGAQAALTKQVQLDPSNAEAWENLGLVRRDLGDTEGAAAAFARAEAIPLELQNLTIGQVADRTWGVEATFSNRTEKPVQNVRLKFTLYSQTGEALETKEATIAGDPLPAGEAERVEVQFTTPVDDARVRYEVL